MNQAISKGYCVIIILAGSFRSTVDSYERHGSFYEKFITRNNSWSPITGCRLQMKTFKRALNNPQDVPLSPRYPIQRSSVHCYDLTIYIAVLCQKQDCLSHLLVAPCSASWNVAFLLNLLLWHM